MTHDDRHRNVALALAESGPMCPPHLRASVEAQVARANVRAAPHASRRVALAGVVAVALAALALAIPFSLGGEPTVVQAHELGGRPVADPSPGGKPGRPELLDREVDGVAFPSWEREFEWNAYGQRSDKIEGRETGTVFYEHEGHTIAYTIVSGKLLDPPEHAERLRRGGVDLLRFRHGGHDVVVFERAGRTCVISGHVKHRSTLLKLAAWKGDGRVTF